jgi:hypothetical protein
MHEKYGMYNIVYIFSNHIFHYEDILQKFLIIMEIHKIWRNLLSLHLCHYYHTHSTLCLNKLHITTPKNWFSIQLHIE